MGTPLRILYHHRTMGRGAEGNHIVSIVTALRDLGHHVDVLSPPGVDPFDPASSVPVDKATVRTSGWSSVWKALSKHLPHWLFEVGEIVYNVTVAPRLRRALREGSYDLVFERYAFYLLAGARAARRAGCRFILEANEVSGIPNRARPQSFPALCSWFERRLLRQCDLVHAVSSYLGERVVAQGVPRSRVAVVPNGFAIERIKPTRTRAQMRNKLGLGDSLVIGFAGWFDRWDRLDFLADIFAEVRAERPGVKLCLVGDGPGAREVQQKIGDSPLAKDITWTGPVVRKEVYDYLQVFDIGILPHSNVFGSPIVMFELMGLGIPLALPRLPPIEDVHRTEDTALLFEPLDRIQCKAALMRLVDSAELRMTLATRARAKLVQQHSWRSTASAIIGALDEENRTGGTATARA